MSKLEFRKEAFIYILFFFAIFSSIFQDFYIFTIEIGEMKKNIVPYWIFLIFIDFVFIFELIFSKGLNYLKQIICEFDTILRISLLSLFIFVVYAVFSAFFMPFLFKGLHVLNPQKGMDIQFHNPSHLKFFIGNVGQSIYIVLNFIFVLSAIFFSSKYKKLPEMLYISTFFSGFTTILFGVFQLFSFKYHNHFFVVLDGILHNNNMYSHCNIFIGRIFSTFTEPSFFAGFLASFLVFLIIKMLDVGLKKGLCMFCLFCLGFIVLIFTYSPTGYLPFSVGVFVLLSYNIIKRDKKKAVKLVVMFVLIFFIVFIFLKEAGVWNSVMEHFFRGVIHKDKTCSFKVRIWSDIFSYKLVFKTYLLGSGLGSNRPSSFFAYTASNLGIIGIISFIGFVVSLSLSFFKKAVFHNNHSVFFAFVTYLLAMFIALPDPNWPPFLWIYAGLVFVEIVKERGADSESHKSLGSNS